MGNDHSLYPSCVYEALFEHGGELRLAATDLKDVGEIDTVGDAERGTVERVSFDALLETLHFIFPFAA